MISIRLVALAGLLASSVSPSASGGPSLGVHVLKYYVEGTSGSLTTDAVTTQPSNSTVIVGARTRGQRRPCHSNRQPGQRLHPVQVVESLLIDQAIVQVAVATKYAPGAGTYDVTWTATPLQGAQLYLVAVQ